MKIQIDKQVIEQALGALEYLATDADGYYIDDQGEQAITALRSALESAESVEQEPVAIVTGLSVMNTPRDIDWLAFVPLGTKLYTQPSPAVPEVKQEPDMYVRKSGLPIVQEKLLEGQNPHNWEPLYRRAVPEVLSFDALCTALICSRVVDPEVIHDADDYDDGVMLGRIKALYWRLLASTTTKMPTSTVRNVAAALRKQP